MATQLTDNSKKRGRPRTTGRGEGVLVRLLPDRMEALDAWIAFQTDPKPSRPEAIRELMRRGLLASGMKAPEPCPPRTLDERIDRAKKRISKPVPKEPSPERGLALLRKGKAHAALAGFSAKAGRKK